MRTGGPLNAAQKEELHALQHQIQVQLRQQRLLVDSIRQLPEVHGGGDSAGGIPTAAIAETAEQVLASLLEQDEVIEKLRLGKHLIGPHPLGDLPAQDSEAEEAPLEAAEPEEDRSPMQPSSVPVEAPQEAAEPAENRSPTQPSNATPEAQQEAAEPAENRSPTQPSDAVAEALQEAAEPAEQRARPSTEAPQEVAESAERQSPARPSSGAAEETTSGAWLGSTQKVCLDLHAHAAVVSPGPLLWGLRAARGPELGDLPAELGEEPGTGEPGLQPRFEAKRDAPACTERPKAELPASASSSSKGSAEVVEREERRAVQAMIPALRGETVDADVRLIGEVEPGREERRWIEAALRRMFRSLGPFALNRITNTFREWKLPPSAVIVKQGAPVTTGPGLCVLFTGVVDVLHCPKGGRENEKVCTFDRCGQVFGEIELFFDSPKQLGNGRKAHWATVATRTPVTLWTISRSALRRHVPGADSGGGACSGDAPGSTGAEPVAPAASEKLVAEDDSLVQRQDSVRLPWHEVKLVV